MTGRGRSLFVAALCSAACASVAARAAAQVVTPEPAPSRSLRLADCVQLALRQNIDVRSAAQEISVSEAERSGARGQFGPKLRVDAYARRWTEAYTIPFALDPTKPPSSFPVHDAFEWNATVSLSQPLTQLFTIYDAYKVRDLGVDIAAVRHDVARREAVYRVIERYYGLLRAERLTEVAAASVEQLGAQLRQANSFHTNGVVSRDDVLRAELALAGAKQRLIATRSRVAIERARLAILVGLPADAPIGAVPLAAGWLPAREPITLERAERAAERQRVELVEIAKRAEQARHEVRLAWEKLVPQVSAVGAYIHNEGSPFTQKNAAYVGGVASWDVWDWGATSSGISAGNARARLAELARSKVADEVRLEVREAFANLSSAAEAMVVAQAQVAQAEEHFRLVRKRYDANAATSFDVVDAEGLLTQARGQMQTALYDYLVARAALRHAMGERPETVARD